MTPAVVIFPILPSGPAGGGRNKACVNHSAPSGPAAMPVGTAEVAYSVMTPAVVIRPIWPVMAHICVECRLSDRLACTLREPAIAGRPGRDAIWLAVGGGDGVLGDDASRCDPGDLVACRLGEPEIAIRSGRDLPRHAVVGRKFGDDDRMGR